VPIFRRLPISGHIYPRDRFLLDSEVAEAEAVCASNSRAAEFRGAKKGRFMEKATQSPARVLSKVEPAQNELGLFSSESVLNILQLIFAGSPLPEVLTIIARLVESDRKGTLCTRRLSEDGPEPCLGHGLQYGCDPRGGWSVSPVGC
jgi:hypothetical protein